jgi:hypothetical protein
VGLPFCLGIGLASHASEFAIDGGLVGQWPQVKELSIKGEKFKLGPKFLLMATGDYHVECKTPEQYSESQVQTVRRSEFKQL